MIFTENAEQGTWNVKQSPGDGSEAGPGNCFISWDSHLKPFPSPALTLFIKKFQIFRKIHGLNRLFDENEQSRFRRERRTNFSDQSAPSTNETAEFILPLRLVKPKSCYGAQIYDLP